MFEFLDGAGLHCRIPGDSRSSWCITADVRALEHRLLDALRVLLIADVLRRRMEKLGNGCVRVTVLENAGQGSRGRIMAAKALGIREPSTRICSLEEDISLQPGEPVFILMPSGAELSIPGGSSMSHLVQVGATAPAGSGGGLARSGLPEDYDPLVLRLALLRFSPSEYATLTTARLHRAEETLQRWRFKVAGWANMPPAAMPREPADAMREALSTDLDTGTVLKLLHHMEVDLQLPSGSKFVTFMYLDQVLGLDLRHLVGKLRG